MIKMIIDNDDDNDNDDETIMAKAMPMAMMMTDRIFPTHNRLAVWHQASPWGQEAISH